MKYISIKSVLYGLSTLVDESMWNENYFLEWAIKGARKLNLVSNYTVKSCHLDIVEHLSTLPADCVSLTMVLIKTPGTSPTEEERADLADLLNLTDVNAAFKWMNGDGLVDKVVSGNTFLNRPYVPMKQTTNPFIKTMNCMDANCVDCVFEYTINPNGTLYSSVREGEVIISYLGYATDNGDCLIEDNEDIKEAIEAYVLHRYFEQKAISGDQVAMNQRDYYRNRFQVLSGKAKNSNLPTVGQLENIANYQNRLKPQSHQFDNLFANFGYKEDTKV